MCLAIPSLVLSVSGDTALVECFGQRRQANLMLLDEPVVAGDFVLVQAGGFAYEKVTAGRAQEALALMEELLGGDAQLLQQW